MLHANKRLVETKDCISNCSVLMLSEYEDPKEPAVTDHWQQFVNFLVCLQCFSCLLFFHLLPLLIFFSQRVGNIPEGEQLPFEDEHRLQVVWYTYLSNNEYSYSFSPCSICQLENIVVSGFPHFL